ncbi:mannonate dehydratase [Domibacillus enclensis]|uniref:Mannonate dehydratase n=1 Tax=Domibacillus enclensis TaxID=1017273 RepID=A0A1N6ZK54_9BACI|nr:mannonate dehydratase [Domibacillus enclensis]OXS76725.1 mannonate dehydratase [Domibacillus enclensis]SIR27199.1 D-mannonate dehydratase [Domibacillus enclensis]
MKVTFRWFGQDDDSVTLKQIRQIPGMYSVVGALHDLPAGEVWPLDRVLALKKEIEQEGMAFDVVESVNVHEDIKLGLPTRDRYIEAYQETIRNLSEAGVKVICYNFMPVFDWTRSHLAKELPDGSTVMAYEKAKVEQVDTQVLIDMMGEEAKVFSLPGWEPERMKTIKRLFEQYQNITEEHLFENLRYFLEKIIPVAEEFNVRMAIHPDDPPWPIFGLPRIVTSKEQLERIVQIVDSPSNAITLCSGSLGANPANNIPEITRFFAEKNKIAFAHIRNVKIEDNGDFYESSHRSEDGSIDIYAVVKALHDTGFDGYFRPDHGRMIWGEKARPGYGLYDRALGIMYILGIWDSLEKEKEEKQYVSYSSGAAK